MSCNPKIFALFFFCLDCFHVVEDLINPTQESPCQINIGYDKSIDTISTIMLNELNVGLIVFFLLPNASFPFLLTHIRCLKRESPYTGVFKNYVCQLMDPLDNDLAKFIPLDICFSYGTSPPHKCHRFRRIQSEHNPVEVMTFICAL